MDESSTGIGVDVHNQDYPSSLGVEIDEEESQSHVEASPDSTAKEPDPSFLETSFTGTTFGPISYSSSDQSLSDFALPYTQLESTFGEGWGSVIGRNASSTGFRPCSISQNFDSSNTHPPDLALPYTQLDSTVEEVSPSFTPQNWFTVNSIFHPIAHYSDSYALNSHSGNLSHTQLNSTVEEISPSFISPETFSTSSTICPSNYSDSHGGHPSLLAVPSLLSYEPQTLKQELSESNINILKSWFSRYRERGHQPPLIIARHDVNALRTLTGLDESSIDQWYETYRSSNVEHKASENIKIPAQIAHAKSQHYNAKDRILRCIKNYLKQQRRKPCVRQHSNPYPSSLRNGPLKCLNAGCSASFTLLSKSIWLRHISRFSPGTVWVCPYCEKVEVRAKLLLMHLQTNHHSLEITKEHVESYRVDMSTLPEIEWQCPLCGLRLDTWSRLYREHLFNHFISSTGYSEVNIMGKDLPPHFRNDSDYEGELIEPQLTNLDETAHITQPSKKHKAPPNAVTSSAFDRVSSVDNDEEARKLLFQLQHPDSGPDVLEFALVQKKHVIVERIINDHLDWVATESFSWIKVLIDAGVSRKEIFNILISLEFESPWIDVDIPTQIEKKPKSNYHYEGCIHTTLYNFHQAGPKSESQENRFQNNRAEESRTERKSLESDKYRALSTTAQLETRTRQPRESDQSQEDIYSAIEKISVLCGIAGAHPKRPNMAEFKDDQVHIVYGKYGGSEKDILEQLTEAANRLLLAMVIAQDAEICCCSFKAAYIDNRASEKAGDQVVGFATVYFGEVIKIVNAINEANSAMALEHNWDIQPCLHLAAASCRNILLQWDALLTIDQHNEVLDIEKIGSDFTGRSTESYASILHICSLTIQFCSLAFLSFIGGCLSSFEIPILTRQISRYHLHGCHVNDDSCTYRIVAEAQALTCVGEMLQDKVMLFHEEKHEATVANGGTIYCYCNPRRAAMSFTAPPSLLEPEIIRWVYRCRMVLDGEREGCGFYKREEKIKMIKVTPSKPAHVYASMTDLAEIWGPITLARRKGEAGPISSHIIAVEMKSGYITLVKDAGTFSPICHWQAMEFDPSNLPEISLSEKYLIGAVNTNRNCRIDAQNIFNQIQGRLVSLNTSSSHWETVQRQAQIGVSYHVSVSISLSQGLIPGITIKDEMIARWKSIYDWGILNEPWGLLVSFCTGVAKRVPLRLVIGEVLYEHLHRVAAPAGTGCETWLKHKSKLYRILYTESCVSLLQSDDDEKFLDNSKIAIGYILTLLRDTGIDRSGRVFKIDWAFERNNPLALQLDAAGAYKWSKILQDSQYCATFAAVTDKCYETTKLKCRGTTRAHPDFKLLSTAVIVHQGPFNSTSNTMCDSYEFRDEELYFVGQPDTGLFLVKLRIDSEDNQQHFLDVTQICLKSYTVSALILRLKSLIGVGALSRVKWNKRLVEI